MKLKHETRQVEKEAIEFHVIPDSQEDDIETETFYVEGFSVGFNLAGLRKKIQEYAYKDFNGIGHESTNVGNGTKFYLKYLSRASVADQAELKAFLRKSYPLFLNKLLNRNT